MTASKDLSSVMPSLIKIKMNCIDGKNFEAKEKYMQLFCKINYKSGCIQRSP